MKFVDTPCELRMPAALVVRNRRLGGFTVLQTADHNLSAADGFDMASSKIFLAFIVVVI